MRPLPHPPALPPGLQWSAASSAALCMLGRWAHCVHAAILGRLHALHVCARMLGRLLQLHARGDAGSRAP